MECYTCLSLSGEHPLFPESKMYDGHHWVVEHGYPVGLKGWLVIILKRHAAALHDLTEAEHQELSTLLQVLPKILKNILNSEKEYLMCFAEAEHFQHVHCHLVAKPHGIPEESKGPNVFTKLGIDESLSISKQELLVFCEAVKRQLAE